MMTRVMQLFARFPVTSPRGEDPGRPADGQDPDCFQSPPREGRIHGTGAVLSAPWLVSSHLPARGGSSRSVMYWMASLFPVTSPRGEDPDAWITGTQPAGFQSPPREGRIGWDGGTRPASEGFQSPPREGRILTRRAEIRYNGCFQSPPREGRIPPENRRIFLCQVSSHLPARGGSGRGAEGK